MGNKYLERAMARMARKTWAWKCQTCGLTFERTTPNPPRVCAGSGRCRGNFTAEKSTRTPGAPK